MKLVFSFLATAILLLQTSSCKKDNIDKNRFYGVWEVRSFITYEPGMSLTTYKPGNGLYLELKSNGTLNKYKNGVIESSSTFQIRKKTPGCGWPGDYFAIEYGNGDHDKIEFKKDTLIISTPPCWADGFRSTYVRVRP